MDDPIYANANHILRNVELIPFNVVRAAAIFQDDKILIKGVLDREIKQIEWLSIQINLPQTGKVLAMMPLSSFELPPKQMLDTSQWTHVFFWKQIRKYYRSGKWETYLAGLSDKLEEQYQEYNKLNNVAVDDSDLFL